MARSNEFILPAAVRETQRVLDELRVRFGVDVEPEDEDAIGDGQWEPVDCEDPQWLINDMAGCWLRYENGGY